MKRKLIVGNWKMNVQLPEEAKNIAKKTRLMASKLDHIEVVVCPPLVFIQDAVGKDKIPNFSVGSQWVSLFESGSHTGDVSSVMLKNLGVEYVIIGHSEQRKVGETDVNVSRKINLVLNSAMSPIVCVGEEVRDESGSHFEFLESQIRNSLQGVPKHKISDLIIAYEPVWAIGASEAMEATQITEMTLFVKKCVADIYGNNLGLHVKVLYGGSVTAQNSAQIVKVGGVDGLLIGRESVNVPKFEELLKSVDEVA